jgi:hypothetical protein
MGLEAHERQGSTSGNTGDHSHSLEGVWNKPTHTTQPPTEATASQSPSPEQVKSPTPIADERSSLIFTDSDGTPVSDAKVAGMTYSGFNDKSKGIELAAMALPSDVLTVSDRGGAHGKHATADDLAQAAHDAVGSGKYGNKVPSSAAEFKGYEVPPNLKCASTSSEWLIQIGMMSNKEYKIRVDDMMKLLPEKGFTKVGLKGDLDLSKFPDGPIGFITGRGQTEDGSSHIGFIEKRNGELRVIHNNYHTGKVVDQDIKEKFYKPNGKPAYRELNLYVFPKGT